MKRKAEYILLSLPRSSAKTDFRPIRFRTYQETALTHLTSRSGVATPDCSIDLNLMVRGNGSFTKDC